MEVSGGEQTCSGARQAGSPCPREVSSGGTGNVCGLSTAEEPGGWNSPDHVVWRLPCTYLPWASASCPSRMPQWAQPAPPSQVGA